MTYAQEHEVMLCLSLRTPLGQLYDICTKQEGQAQYLSLPDGQVVNEFLILPFGPAMLQHTTELLLDEDMPDTLVSRELEQQVKKNRFCLAVAVSTGPTSSHYFALSECHLSPAT